MRTLLKKARRSFILLTAGAAIGYFFDPDSGEQRRIHLGEQLRELMDGLDFARGADDASATPAPLTSEPEPTVADVSESGLAEQLLHGGSESSAATGS